VRSGQQSRPTTGQVVRTPRVLRFRLL